MARPISDWEPVRTEYLRGERLQDISSRHNISPSCIAHKASRDGWKIARNALKTNTQRLAKELTDPVHNLVKLDQEAISKQVNKLVKTQLAHAETIMQRSIARIEADDPSKSARELLNASQAWTIGLQAGRQAVGLGDGGGSGGSGPVNIQVLTTLPEPVSSRNQHVIDVTPCAASDDNKQ